MEGGATEKLTKAELYHVGTALEFYNRIAESYDKRNSPPLLRVYEQVIQAVERARQSGSGIAVLDLGGGTGKGVAHHFFQHAGMQWEYVDASERMALQFSGNLKGTALKTSCNICDLHAFLADRQPEKYDVVLLSLVLTSLERNPDWSAVAARLKPSGRLVVADIDAIYTAQNPYYTIEVGGLTHSLTPRAVTLTQIYVEAKRAGLKLEDMRPVLAGSVPYAYVVEFSIP